MSATTTPVPVEYVCALCDSMSCQAGAEAQCVNGSWKLTGSECAGQAADPSDEEAEPGVVGPRVGEPQVVQPGVGSAKPPSTLPGGD